MGPGPYSSSSEPGCSASWSGEDVSHDDQRCLAAAAGRLLALAIGRQVITAAIRVAGPRFSGNVKQDGHGYLKPVGH